MTPITDHAAEAQEVASRNGTGTVDDPYRLLSLTDLGNLPAQEWLIENVIRARGTNVEFGPSGIGKSFTATDLGLCVCTGKPWAGLTGKSGPVLYWAAEGAYGIRQRVLAWCEYHGQAEPTAEQMRWVPDSANLLDAKAFARARATVAAMEPKPVLLIFDTLSRLMPGANESSAQDMSAFVYAIDQLRQGADDAAALVIHHTGKDGLRERGSSVLEAAADMMLSLKPMDAGMVLGVEKAKDSKPAGPWRLRLEPSGESTVIVRDSGGSGIGPVELLAVRALSEQFDSGDEASYSRLMTACGAHGMGQSEPARATGSSLLRSADTRRRCEVRRTDRLAGSCATSER